MRKSIIILLVLFIAAGIGGCNKNSMNHIIENEPNITGIVKEVHILNTKLKIAC